jgi:dihydrofolate reductase
MAARCLRPVISAVGGLGWSDEFKVRHGLNKWRRRLTNFMNNTPKYIVSSTVHALDWGNSTLVTGDLAEEAASLRAQPGKNIQVPGSPTLVRLLLRDGLPDDHRWQPG